MLSASSLSRSEAQPRIPLCAWRGDGVRVSLGLNESDSPFVCQPLCQQSPDPQVPRSPYPTSFTCRALPLLGIPWVSAHGPSVSRVVGAEVPKDVRILSLTISGPGCFRPSLLLDPGSPVVCPWFRADPLTRVRASLSASQYSLGPLQGGDTELWSWPMSAGLAHLHATS